MTVFTVDGETGEAIFKTFPGYQTFDGYMELVKEEANYWKGYGPYLEKVIREKELYSDLDEALALVRKATNLRQSIYNDVKLMDKAEAGSKKLADLEKRMVLKSFELAKLRSDFVDFLYSLDETPLRQKYSKKEKVEKTDD